MVGLDESVEVLGRVQGAQAEWVRVPVLEGDEPKVKGFVSSVPCHVTPERQSCLKGKAATPFI